MGVLGIFGWAGNIVAEQASKVMIVANNSTTYKFCTNPTVKTICSVQNRINVGTLTVSHTQSFHLVATLSVRSVGDL